MNNRRKSLTTRLKLLLVLALGLMTLSNAVPSHAFSQAAFPAVSQGNRGANVKAIQLVLNIGADGVFGSGTRSSVINFQSSRGLTADGVVGPATWAALLPTVRSGSSGQAVKALQMLLNEKRGTSLAVDGAFGGGTDSAVRTFQSHAGLSADGVVGPTTWKNLVWHYEYFRYTSASCNQSPDGNSNADWGTAETIGQMEAAVASFAGTGNGPVPIGDISNEHGGDIPGHASHELGVDVDLWPIRTDNAQCYGGRITWQSGTYDRAATRQLVQAIRNAAPGKIALIYFNDPTLINEGLTTSYPNHDNHLHVRYK